MIEFLCVAVVMIIATGLIIFGASFNEDNDPEFQDHWMRRR